MKTLVDVLESLPLEVRLEIDFQLNLFKWPVEILYFKPIGWDFKSRVDRMSEDLFIIIQTIVSDTITRRQELEFRFSKMYPEIDVEEFIEELQFDINSGR